MTRPTSATSTPSTELSKLLLIEFGLVYANDWFLCRHVQAGSVLKVRGLAVTNNFGERFWIEAAGAAPTKRGNAGISSA